jgi:Fic-DOC domain mobile mystery protein B
MAKRKVDKVAGKQFEMLDGATPLDANEMQGLLIDTITTQAELNFAEQQSIIESSKWIFETNHKKILTDQFFKNLHKKMFQSIWAWAGMYRTTNKNIGVEPYKISTEIKKLCDDCEYWIEHKTYDWSDIAARFHHKVVWIHPFANGNGRFSRILTDILLKKHNQTSLTWGRNTFSKDDFSSESALRAEYILSLREADNKNFKKLVHFIRS